MIKKIRSTQATIVLLISFVALLSILLTAGFAYSHYRHELKTITNIAQHAADQIGARQSRVVQESEVLLRQLIKHPDFNLLDLDRCNRYAQELRFILPDHSNVAIADRNGNVVCSAVPLTKPVNLADRSYFKKALASGNFEGGEFVIGRVTGRAATNFGLALYDPLDYSRIPNGVAYIAIDVLKLNQILIDSLPQNGAVLTLVSKSGDIITRYPDPEGFSGKRFPDSELVKNIASQKGRGIFQVKGLDGVDRIYAFSPVKGTSAGEYSLVVGVPVREATSQFRQVLATQGLILLIVFGGVLVVGFIIVRRFSTRLRAVTNVAGEIRNGNYSARSGLHTREDDIGELAATFDQMAETLARRDLEQRQSVATIREMNELLEARVTERTSDLDKAANRLEQLNSVLAETLSEKEKQAATMQSVADLTDQLQACRVLEEAYQLIARHCQVVGGSPLGGIYIIRSSRNRVERVASWGIDENLVQDCAPHDCWALRKGAAYRVAENLPNPPCSHVQDVGSFASTCLPIVAQGEMIGFIYVVDKNASAGGSTPTIDSAKYLASVAEYGGQTIAALQMREELQRQLIRDPLTGLFNRRYMEETLDREKNRAARLGVPVSVISFDIDHFKHINDTYGHDAGDVALKAVADVLKKGVRAEDIVCRTGGEEILVVLPSASSDDAAELADRLRRSVEDITVECAGIRLPRITISGGLAGFPGDGQDWQTILRVGDQRLYEAKRAGRNRIVGSSLHVIDEVH